MRSPIVRRPRRAISLQGRRWSRAIRSISAIGRDDVEDRARGSAAPRRRAPWTGQASGSRPRRRHPRRLRGRRSCGSPPTPASQPMADLAFASHASRISSSRVARTIQSRSGEVRLRTNRSSPRSSDAERRAGPAVGRAAVARGCRSGRARSSSSASGRSRQPVTRRGADSARRRHVERSRPARRPGTPRANRGSCGSGPRRAARSSMRSPRRGPRRPGCR